MQTSLGLKYVDYVDRTRFIFCSLHLKSWFRIIESFWLEGILEALWKDYCENNQTYCEKSMNRDPANFFDDFFNVQLPSQNLNILRDQTRELKASCPESVLLDTRRSF